jgi:hypothetical protein
VKLTRRRGNDGGDNEDRREREDRETRPGRHVRNRRTVADTAAADAAAADESDELEAATASGREYGPWDVSDAPPHEGGRLDLGALQVPAVAGVEVHLQAGPNGHVQAIQLAHGGSRLQLGAFAAPRTEGIWDEIRETLRTTLQASGAKPQEIEGEYGPELTARVSDGSTTVDVRHIGIDGPRWFVHGVYIGSAALDPERAGPLRDVLHGLVVDRGTEAMPVQEALPLRLPAEAAAQLAAAAEERGESQAT